MLRFFLRLESRLRFAAFNNERAPPPVGDFLCTSTGFLHESVRRDLVYDESGWRSPYDEVDEYQVGVLEVSAKDK